MFYFESFPTCSLQLTKKDRRPCDPRKRNIGVHTTKNIKLDHAKLQCIQVCRHSVMKNMTWCFVCLLTTKKNEKMFGLFGMLKMGEEHFILSPGEGRSISRILPGEPKLQDHNSAMEKPVSQWRPLACFKLWEVAENAPRKRSPNFLLTSTPILELSLTVQPNPMSLVGVLTSKKIISLCWFLWWWFGIYSFEKHTWKIYSDLAFVL